MTFPMIYVADFPAYIAIYHADGTVAVSHGGSEIGQGINTKVAQVVAYTLGIPLSYVTITPHNSIISANRSLTGAAITSESICMAAKKACERILERLKPVRDKMPGASWVEIVQKAWDKHIDLTEKQIFYKKDAKTYNVVGCACAEIELDVLTGNVQILRVDIVEDTGNSMNPLVDVGQIEGLHIFIRHEQCRSTFLIIFSIKFHLLIFDSHNIDIIFFSNYIRMYIRCIYDGGWVLVNGKTGI